MIPIKGLVCFCVALASLVWLPSMFSRIQKIRSSNIDTNKPPVLTSTENKMSEKLHDVQNRTLGFEKIFAISLPERTDKRDGMMVAASLTNISVNFLDGVHGPDVSSKALPFGFDRKPTVVGSWRAHMNVAATMVKEDIRSALIFEDDADWDVTIKYQMAEFARGSRYLLELPPDKQPRSPYGDGWDMLWLGHCGVLEKRSDPRRWIVANDATVEPSKFHKDNVDTPTLEPFGKEHTRMVFKSANGCCVVAYALSLSGARKTLNMMSLRPWDGPVDWGWNDLCKNSITNFVCISPFPQLFGVHRPAGNQSRWSDIESVTQDSVGESHSLHLVFPARMNVERLLTGDTKFLSQFPDHTGSHEMEFSDIIQFRGYPSAVDFELPPIPKV